MGKKSVSYEKRVEIVTLKNLGIYSQQSIAEIAKVSKKCVWTTINNYIANESYMEKQRSGAPRKSTEREDQRLLTLARATPTASLRDLSAAWLRNNEPIATPRTVASRLHEFELESHVAAEKPFLTNAHKEARLKWCEERRDWGYGKWADIIFSDESNFKIVNRKTKPTVWRFRHEKYHDNMVMPRKQGGGGSIGIWGCIGEHGAGCCTIFPGRMNQFRYLDLLEDELRPSISLLEKPGRKIIYQQDGATCHTAKRVKAWFEENEIELLPWPANSPDLNPIEHLWVEIDKKLAKIQLVSMAELEEALHKYWCEITRHDVLNLIESMPERVEAVIKARGGHTKY